MASVNDIKTAEQRTKYTGHRASYKGNVGDTAIKIANIDYAADLRAYAEQLEAERDSYKTAAELAVESQNQAQSDAERAEKRVAELEAENKELQFRLGTQLEKVMYLAKALEAAQVLQPVGAVVTDDMVKAAEETGDLYRLGNPELIRKAISAALAAQTAAPAAPLDISGLTRYEESEMEGGGVALSSTGNFVKLSDVQAMIDAQRGAE